MNGVNWECSKSEVFMINVKRFTFNVDFIVRKEIISSYVLEEQYLDITLKDSRVVTPYLNFTSISESIPNFDAEDMVEGYINDCFNVVDCDVKNSEGELSFYLTFTIDFDPSCQVEFDDATLVYHQGDGDYKYIIEGAFTDINAPSLIHCVDVDSSISMRIKESVVNRLI